MSFGKNTNFGKLNSKFFENDNEMIHEVIKELEQTQDINVSNQTTWIDIIEKKDAKFDPDIAELLRNKPPHIKTAAQAIQWIKDEFLTNSKKDVLITGINAFSDKIREYKVYLLGALLAGGVLVGGKKVVARERQDNINSPENIALEIKKQSLDGHFELTPEQTKKISELEMLLDENINYQIELKDDGASIKIDKIHNKIDFIKKIYGEKEGPFGSREFEKSTYSFCHSNSKIENHDAEFGRVVVKSSGLEVVLNQKEMNEVLDKILLVSSEVRDNIIKQVNGQPIKPVKEIIDMYPKSK